MFIRNLDVKFSGIAVAQMGERGTVNSSLVNCPICGSVLKENDLVVFITDNKWNLSHVSCALPELKSVVEESELASSDAEEYVKRFKLLEAL